MTIAPLLDSNKETGIARSNPIICQANIRAVPFSILLCAVMVEGTDVDDPAGKAGYLADCTHCYAVDEKGDVPIMST